MKKFKKLFLVLFLGLAIILPMQASNASAAEPRSYQGRKIYEAEVWKKEYNILQCKIPTLCPYPAVFEWYDNGIPEDALIILEGWYVAFNEEKVFDTGYGITDAGIYFRKFEAKLNNGKSVYFWANAKNKTDLIWE